MNNPRFISVDTSHLNDGDALIYNGVIHSIEGLPSGQPRVQQIAVAISGDTTLTSSQVASRLIALRGTPLTPFIIILPSVAFHVEIVNQTGVNATITRAGGSTNTTLAPSTGSEFYYIP